MKIISAVLVIVAMLVARPAAAQRLDPDYCWTCMDTRHHFYAGAALAVASRGPYVAKGWRNRAWKRVAVVTGVGAAYELMQMYEAKQRGQVGPGYGFGPKDLVADFAGAVVVETVFALGRKIF